MSASRPFEIGLFTFGEITADPVKVFDDFTAVDTFYPYYSR
jgi:hypothetical protein